MDWTGGVRRRYTGKGKNSAAIAKQRAHFAKVRGAAAIRKESVLSGLQGASSSLLQNVQETRSTDWALKTTGFSFPSNATDGPDPVRPTRETRAQDTRKPERVKMQQVEHQFDARGKTPEELLLLQKRKRLLARADWLGLAVARPLRITFTSAHEKDLIGKRRKIKKFSHKRGSIVMTTRPTVVSPETRHRQFSPRMSGALPAEDDQMVIKIGAHALRSSALPSQGNRSATPPSRGSLATSSMSSLSEESMLLGADGDVFEMDSSAPTRRRELATLMPGTLASAEEVSNLVYESPRSSLAVMGSVAPIRLRSSSSSDSRSNCRQSHQRLENPLSAIRYNHDDVAPDKTRPGIPVSPKYHHVFEAFDPKTSLTEAYPYKGLSDYLRPAQTSPETKPISISTDPRLRNTPHSLHHKNVPPCTPSPHASSPLTADEMLWRKYLHLPDRGPRRWRQQQNSLTATNTPSSESSDSSANTNDNHNNHNSAAPSPNQPSLLDPYPAPSPPPLPPSHPLSDRATVGGGFSGIALHPTSSSSSSSILPSTSTLAPPHRDTHHLVPRAPHPATSVLGHAGTSRWGNSDSDSDSAEEDEEG